MEMLGPGTLDSSRQWQNTSSVRKDEDASKNWVSVSAIPLSREISSENDYTDINGSCLIYPSVRYEAGVSFSPSWVNRGYEQAKSKSGSRASLGLDSPAVRKMNVWHGLWIYTYLSTSLGHLRCGPAQEGCQGAEGTRHKVTPETRLP